MIEAIDLLKDLHLAGFNFCFQCQETSQYYNLAISDEKKKKVKVISTTDINEISYGIRKLLEVETEDEDLL